MHGSYGFNGAAMLTPPRYRFAGGRCYVRRMSPFHPELRRFAALVPPVSFGPRLARLANWIQNRRGVPPLATALGVTIRDELFDSADGHRLRIRIYMPTGTAGPRPAMLWIHGGGFVIGTPEQDEAVNIEICTTLGFVIVAVDYRLAVTAAFPTPLEDCYEALAWLHAHADVLGVDRARIVVGGASAGAGLAAGLVLLAHDRKQLAIGFQLLIYPMIDDRTVLRTDVDERRLRLWTTRSNRFGWRTYLGREPGGADVPVYAAPARRANLSGLPPAWIGVGTCDVFHDEDLDYARRLNAAGVACAVKVVEGAFHGFEIAGAEKGVVRDFRESFMSALRRFAA